VGTLFSFGALQESDRQFVSPLPSVTTRDPHWVGGISWVSNRPNLVYQDTFKYPVDESSHYFSPGVQAVLIIELYLFSS